MTDIINVVFPSQKYVAMSSGPVASVMCIKVDQ